MNERRRKPTRSASTPAGRSTARRARPYEPTTTPAMKMLMPKSSVMAGSSGVRMLVAAMNMNSDAARR